MSVVPAVIESAEKLGLSVQTITCGIKSTRGPVPFNWVCSGIYGVRLTVLFGATIYDVEEELI
jgi:hypothetical protein